MGAHVLATPNLSGGIYGTPRKLERLALSWPLDFEKDSH